MFDFHPHYNAGKSQMQRCTTIIALPSRGVKVPIRVGLRSGCNSPCHFNETSATEGNRAAVV
jgi:hypothetical protein